MARAAVTGLTDSVRVTASNPIEGSNVELELSRRG